MFRHFKIKPSGRLLQRPLHAIPTLRMPVLKPTLVLRHQALALSTLKPSNLSEKITPEMEQLLETAVEETLEEEESNTGVRLAKT